MSKTTKQRQPLASVRSSNNMESEGLSFSFRTLRDILPELSRRKLKPVQRRRDRYILLRRLLSQIRWGWGERDENGQKHIRPVNVKSAIISAKVFRDRWLIRPTNADYELRFAGKLMYASGSEDHQRYSLLCLDVDYESEEAMAEHYGEVEQAMADALGTTFVDPSKNGSHVWIVMDKVGQRGRNSNARFREEFQAIKKKIESVSFPGVEQVEVKATLPVWMGQTVEPDFGQQGDHVYNGGSFATIPNINSDEQTINLLNTPVFNLSQLDEAVDRLVEVAPTRKKEKPKRKPAGSTVEFVFTDQDKHLFGNVFLPMAHRLVTEHGERMHQPGTKDRVNEVDVAADLYVLYVASKTPYDNGAMPNGRIRRGWNALIDAGIINRSWKAVKHKVVRNFLSDLGLIDWEDTTYWFYPEESEKRGKGKAMRWALSAEFMAEIDSLLSNILSTTGIRGTPILSIRENAPIIRPILVIPLDEYRREEEKQHQREEQVVKHIFSSAA